MGETADVVVIGGGIIGASVAWHLADAGLANVTLLERDEVAQGTSGAGAGFVAPWADGFIPGLGRTDLRGESYALDFYRRLAGEGERIGYRPNGLLSVSADGSMAPVAPLLERSREARRCTAEEVSELTAGAIPAAAVAGGAFVPGAAQISAPLATAALARRFVELGGRLAQHRPALALDVGRDGCVRGVLTRSGQIACGAVVLAAGCWARELLAPLGCFLPVAPLLTSRLITEPVGVPGEMPMLFVYGLQALDSLWVRGESGALVFGGHYRSEPESTYLDRALPTSFAEVSLEGVMRAQRAGSEAARILDAFRRYRTFTVAHGAPCFTADSRPLVGDVPGLPGLHVVAGDNEAGVTHAPAFGHAIATRILDGETAHLEAWRVDRFGAQLDSEAAVAAAHRTGLPD